MLRLQGYRKDKPLRQAVKDILVREIQESYRLVEPVSLYTEVKVEALDRGIITLAGGLVLKVEEAARDWRGAERLGIALCTIGPALEERAEQLFAQQEFAPALMLDSAGSIAVESLADQMNYVFCHKAHLRGSNTGPRQSPGYGRWGLTDQRVLFSLLPGEKIGIRLNEQCMMIPRKSISFCLGIGKVVGEDQGVNPCRHCGIESCQYRRQKHEGS